LLAAVWLLLAGGWLMAGWLAAAGWPWVSDWLAADVGLAVTADWLWVTG
jgi:hypothetical protein